MRHDKLKDKLSTNSPFIFKKKIEKEDQWEFKGDEIILNEKVIGLYSVEEKQTYFNVKCFTNGYDIKDPILIVLDYNDKPVLLTNTDKEEPVTENHLFDNALKLIPREQYLSDEKAEL